MKKSYPHRHSGRLCANAAILVCRTASGAKSQPTSHHDADLELTMTDSDFRLNPPHLSGVWCLLRGRGARHRPLDLVGDGSGVKAIPLRLRGFGNPPDLLQCCAPGRLLALPWQQPFPLWATLFAGKSRRGDLHSHWLLLAFREECQRQLSGQINLRGTRSGR